MVENVEVLPNGHNKVQWALGDGDLFGFGYFAPRFAEMRFVMSFDGRFYWFTVIVTANPRTQEYHVSYRIFQAANQEHEVNYVSWEFVSLHDTLNSMSYEFTRLARQMMFNNTEIEEYALCISQVTTQYKPYHNITVQLCDK